MICSEFNKITKITIFPKNLSYISYCALAPFTTEDMTQLVTFKVAWLGCFIPSLVIELCVYVAIFVKQRAVESRATEVIIKNNRGAG